MWFSEQLDQGRSADTLVVQKDYDRIRSREINAGMDTAERMSFPVIAKKAIVNMCATRSIAKFITESIDISSLRLCCKIGSD